MAGQSEAKPRRTRAKKTWVSVAEYARRKGVSRRTVYDWAGAGLVARRPDGRLCVEDTDAALAARRAASLPPESVDSGEPKSEDPASWTHAEAARQKEIALALLRRQEVRHRGEELVEAQPVADSVYEANREARDHVLGFPARWASELAGRWGLEVKLVRQGLEEAARDTVATMPPLDLEKRLARRRTVAA